MLEDKSIFVRYRNACSPILECDYVFKRDTYRPEKCYARDLPIPLTVLLNFYKCIHDNVQRTGNSLFSIMERRYAIDCSDDLHVRTVISDSATKRYVYYVQYNRKRKDGSFLKTF